MAYKVRIGHAEMSGTLGTDDIIYSDDDDVMIDFDSDKIKFKTNNSNRLQVGNSRVQVQKQLVVGSNSAGDFALEPPSEDGLHVQDGNVMLQTNSADADASELLFNKSRNATDGSVTVVQDNDKLGGITFGGADGTNYDPAASISAHVDGAPGSNDMPGRLVFSTTADGSNSTTERMRIDSSGKVGIGGTPTELLTLNGASDSSECFIQFREGAADRAKVGVNTSNNLLFHNQHINKHIVFKVNDQGVTREALRIDGAVSEVVVNQSSESLVDFRVESNNRTHMLFVDGSTDKIGIMTNQPETALDVNADAIRLRNSSTPSSASDYGFPGEIRWDTNYIYVCVATDTWKRVALSSW